jgi:hypothetical protein
MGRSQHWAAAHRDGLLGRTRAISLAVAGAAAAASLGLGTAFAREIPGPSRSPAGATQQAHSRQHKHLTPPPQQPATTPAPPQVSSGGS